MNQSPSFPPTLQTPPALNPDLDPRAGRVRDRVAARAPPRPIPNVFPPPKPAALALRGVDHVRGLPRPPRGGEFRDIEILKLIDNDY